jgi:peptidoglycan/xylan/chitin deacetylase (PgdA/CDA1 family)
MAGIRLDRALTMAVFHPWRRVWGGVGARLPVLMYHHVCDEAEDRVSPYYRVNTSPAVFRRHLAFLAGQGWRTMDLAQVAGLLTGGGPLPAKTVVITFDDGFRDFCTEAFPALQEHHFTAAVFLPTAFIQGERRRFKGAECLTWEEVRQLRQAGISFGSHTVNHPKLVELGWPEIQRELRDSKDQLEQQLGEPVTTFAYPFAFPRQEPEFARSLRGLLVQNGYSCCATTEIGRVKAGDDPFRLKRLPANSLDDPGLFQAKLEGGYDWLAWAQAAIKKLKPTPRLGAKWSNSAVPIEHSPLH